ncbi:MAG: N-acetylmuramoyl-L-alanine amidase [Desulfobacterales bacterium]|nr:N-acetylmuramoyl-L-alanine amidase [Desulfobacterales bacterium]
MKLLFIPVVLCFYVGGLFSPDAAEAAYSRSELKRFQGSITDHRHRINPRFKKKTRRHTRMIIVHTSELGLEGTLRVISKGKKFKNGRSTPGGHAHYVIARNGRTYRTLDRRYRADHAGLSMWNGKTDVSDVSIGIELVGYHHAPISKSQYRSLGMLLHVLKQVYGLKDRDILTHSQVAYGRPNPWFKKNHRGRKRCAKNFDRAKANLGPTWSYDPDVRARRLQADPILASVFYGTPGSAAPGKAVSAKRLASNIISKQNSAWSIAGDEYNAATTAYILPDGRALPGDRVGGKIGWSRLPVGTKVLLNQETRQVSVQAKSPVKLISGQMTAWSHAGQDYRSDSTIYFLPSGRITPGSGIRDWDDLPVGTRLMVGYKGPYEITRQKTAYKIAGKRYKHKSVVYYLPGGRLVPGDEVRDFNDLPRGVSLYLPLSPGG